MSFKKKFHRIISMFCVAVLLLPMVLGLSVSAAEKRYLGYPVNLLIGKKLGISASIKRGPQGLPECEMVFG